jgi:hypothetical protein
MKWGRRVQRGDGHRQGSTAGSILSVYRWLQTFSILGDLLA